MATLPGHVVDHLQGSRCQKAIRLSDRLDQEFQLPQGMRRWTHVERADLTRVLQAHELTTYLFYNVLNVKQLELATLKVLL